MSQGIFLWLLLLPCGQMEDEFYQDFRSGGAMSPGLVLFGPEAEKVIRNDSKGLRITLPAKRKNGEAVGVSPRFRISGDFEITLGYEILSAKEPPSGLGSGVKIWGKLGSEDFQAMTLAHLVRPEGGPGFVAILAKESDGERNFTQESAATEAMRGRLRLSRTGSTLSFLVAEDDEESFRELQAVDVGLDDVLAFRISASSADDSSGLAIRLHDLRIRADDLPAAYTASGRGEGGAVVWIVVIVVGFVVGFSIWLYRRRQRE